MLEAGGLAVEAGCIFMQFEGMRCVVVKCEGVEGVIGVVEEVDVEWLNLVAADKKSEDVKYFCFFHSIIDLMD